MNNVCLGLTIEKKKHTLTHIHTHACTYCVYSRVCIYEHICIYVKVKGRSNTLKHVFLLLILLRNIETDSRYTKSVFYDRLFHCVKRRT